MAKLTYTREKALKLSININLRTALDRMYGRVNELWLHGSYNGAFKTWTEDILALKNEKLPKVMIRMEKQLCTKQ